MTNLVARQIVESLRTGVPIRDAVQIVGSGQPRLEEQFNQLLTDIRRGNQRSDNGFIYFGDFGTGKSHVLEYFSTVAENSNFVVSKVTVSKNLQLSNFRGILSSLMSQMSTKDHREEALARILDDSSSKGFDYSTFESWCQSEVSTGNLSSIYLAIATYLKNLRYGTEEFDKVMSYLSGAATKVEIKRAVSAPRAVVPPADLRTWETLHFVSNLFIHLGFNGWLLLFDELELIRMIGTQSARVSRGRSYAAISNWFGLGNKKTVRRYASIGCMTTGFVDDIINYGQNSWNDSSNVPSALEMSTSPQLVQPAETAMKFISAQDEKADLQLLWPDLETKITLQASLRAIYDAAYETKSPVLEIVGESFESIRIYIRRWIAQWDLHRQHRKDSLSVNAIKQNYVPDEDDSDED